MLGSILAFVIATACCWLPWLIIVIGGASSAAGLMNGLNSVSGPFMIIGVLFLTYGSYQFFYKKNKKVEAILQSIITCPKCQYQKEETMPSDACQYFYECENCKTVLKPINNDCCVFCSYGTVACPPIQLDKNCC